MTRLLFRWSETRRCFIAIAVQLFFGKFQENQEALELNGTHWLLFTVCVNLLDQHINTTQSSSGSIDSGEETGLEVNEETTKYMLMSCHQNSEHYHNNKGSLRIHENVTDLQYFEQTALHLVMNYIHDEINNLFRTTHFRVLSSNLLSKTQILQQTKA